MAIFNRKTGKVKVSGGTITSENSTIMLASSNLDSISEPVLQITDGTIESTGTGNCSAIEINGTHANTIASVTAPTGKHAIVGNSSTDALPVNDFGITSTISYKYISFADATSLTFTDSDSYDVPAGMNNTTITNINVLGGVSGGVSPYTFTLENAPDWLNISTQGVISGIRPATAQNASTAIVKVSDGISTKTITINVGAVTVTTPMPTPTPPTTTTSSSTTDNTPSTSAPAKVVEQIKNATKGSTVTINGAPDTPISKDILKQLKETGCKLEIKYAGFTWVIDGSSITDTSKDINLIITKITSNVEGDITAFNIEYTGDFPFKAKLKVDLAGYIKEGTKVYLYKIVDGKRIYQSSAVSSGYSATFDRNSASQYVISTVKTGDLSAGEGAHENITPLTVIQNGIPFLIISVILATGIVVYKRKVNR